MSHTSDDERLPREDSQTAAEADNAALPVKQNNLGIKKLERLRKSYERRGVIHISRIPPHMVPNYEKSELKPSLSHSLQALPNFTACRSHKSYDICWSSMGR